jgi:hypothetical protein
MANPRFLMTITLRARLSLLAVSMAVVCGCSRGPAFQYVEGVVMLDGKPVEGAIVSFTPSGPGVAAAGTTDANGAYRLNPLTGRQAGVGTLAGDYVVAVRRWKYPDPGPRPDPSDKKAYDAWEVRSLTMGRQEPIYDTPKAYGEAATSGLKVTVKKGRNNGDAFRFNLKSDFTGK